MNKYPLHLLLPLAASLLFVCGLICIKRTNAKGVSPWTVTFLANQWAALLFSTLWLLGGEGQPLSMMWQPAIIAALYICGQVCTFSAIRFGDVSVATPIFGIKVVLVAFLVTFLFRDSLTGYVWAGAFLSAIGIALVQWAPRTEPNDSVDASKGSRRKGIVLTVVLAVLASLAFATFDVLVQSWAPAWGAGRFLPISYWIVAVLSLGFFPWFQRDLAFRKDIRGLLLPGTFLIGMQAICIVFTLSTFGDAPRVNVVYALRALWGVSLAWAVAKVWGGSEASLPGPVLTARFMGAGLLTAAVVLVIYASS